MYDLCLPIDALFYLPRCKLPSEHPVKLEVANNNKGEE